MTLDVKILKAKVSDLNTLKKLWLGLYEHHDPYRDPYLTPRKKNAPEIWKKYIKKELRKKHSIILIAKINNQIVGYLTAFEKYNTAVFNKKKTAYVHDIFVDARFRNQGIGNKLILHLEKILKKRNVKLLRLEVHYKNTRALKFYKKTGFKDHLIHLQKVLK